jgi:chromosome segregation ATPase
MGGFLKALEKVGLVKVEGSVEGLRPEPVLDLEPSVPSPAKTKPVETQSGGAIVEGQPFESFYAGLTASAYPAEKMLKLIDGLKAMDANTRLAAVKAMDAADDNWSLDDAVADARAKIAALTGQASAFTAQVTAIEKDTGAMIKALDKENDNAVSAVRKQIADLEALLARQIEKIGGSKAAAQNQLQAAREACTRETGRLHAEAARLNMLVDLFGAPKGK